MAHGDSRRVVITDANVLINFGHVDRLDLLGALPPLEFVVPEQVVDEVSDPTNSARLRRAIEDGAVRPIVSTDLNEIQDYADLRQSMGKGEAACLAIADARGWIIASDERRRFLRVARERLGDGRVVNTPGILVLAIRSRVLSVDQADEIKERLEKHRFRMKFGSFREFLPGEES